MNLQRDLSGIQKYIALYLQNMVKRNFNAALPQGVGLASYRN